MNANFNDSLDDVFGGAPASPVAPAAPVEHRITLSPEMTRAAELGGFFERCPKCAGSGSWRGRGMCFACKGKGGRTFKTSSADRAKARAGSAGRQARKQAAHAEMFAAEIAWLQAAAKRQLAGPMIRWQWPVDVAEKLARYGELTDGQIEAIRRFMARDAERAAAPKPEAKVVDVSKIERAFDKARASAARPGQMGVWVRPLQLTSGDVSLSIREGSAGSEWAGMLFIKTKDGKKLGFVKGGKFTARRECTDTEQAAVLDACSDPAKAAVAFGKAWSICCVCARPLTNDGSIEAGIGPVCAEKFGF